MIPSGNVPSKHAKPLPGMAGGAHPDLTTKPGNPAHALQQAYPELMKIADFSELAAKATQVVTTSGGISDKNTQKFLFTLKNIQRKGGRVTDLQSYITNFILAGANLKVAEDIIAAFAADITETIGEAPVYTEEQLILKQLVESYGYKVTLI